MQNEKHILDELLKDGAPAVQDGPEGETPQVSRKVRKHHKRSRSKTIAPRRLTKEELREAALLPIVVDEDRPRTRADCAGSARPCPWVSCKHHLFLDVNPASGSIKLNFPDKELSDMSETCALDVADRGGTTLEEVGVILNLTRERIRQIEAKALRKLRHPSRAKLLKAFVD